ncbi:MAG: RNA polymerase sigma factor [Bacteroidota bacterium]
MLSEQQLIKDCQRGKKSSQYELVRRYSGMLLTICRRYASDEAMAKDILQETLIRIFTQIDKYRATGSFEGWMRRIAVRTALNWLDRKYIRRETYPVELEVDGHLDPTILDQLGAEEILKLVQGLPLGFRTVFNLYAIEGYTHQEIAELLQISESASRSQLSRARRLLQKKFNTSQISKFRSA